MPFANTSLYVQLAHIAAHLRSIYIVANLSILSERLRLDGRSCGTVHGCGLFCSVIVLFARTLSMVTK
jgi:hypothetical protein